MPIKEIEDSIINKNNIPKHIAIIMDGNGRWAKAHSLPRIAGHKEGIDSVRAITKKCGDIGVKHLSLYTFSSENWHRPKNEVKALMRLLLLTIRREIKDLNKNNVRLSTIGNMDDLPDDARKGMEEGLKITEISTKDIKDKIKKFASKFKIPKNVANAIWKKMAKAGLDPLKIQKYSTLLTTYINLMDENLPEVAPPGKEKMIKKLKKIHGVDSEIPFKIAWSQHNKEKG